MATKNINIKNKTANGFMGIFNDCISVYYKEDQNIMNAQLSKNGVRKLEKKLGTGIEFKRKLVENYLNTFKMISKNSPRFRLANYIYNFIVTTDLLEKYIIPCVIIFGFTIDFNKLVLTMTEGCTLYPVLQLKFSEKDNDYECAQVTLYKSRLEKEGSKYITKITSKNIVIKDNIINDSSYIVKANEENKVLSLSETANYQYYTTNKSIRYNLKYAIESLYEGKSLSEVSNCNPSSNEMYVSTLEFKEYDNKEKYYIYKGTYTTNNIPSLNITRIYQENKNTPVQSIDKYYIYKFYDIHSLLFRSPEGIQNLHEIPDKFKLTSETIEYTEDFYKSYSLVLQELPSSKNYYYTQDSILEISYSEIPGSGKRLKKTNQYYKLLYDTKARYELYVIKPDLTDISKSKYEFIDSHCKISTGTDIVDEVETKIKEACNTVGVQYR